MGWVGGCEKSGGRGVWVGGVEDEGMGVGVRDGSKQN